MANFKTSQPINETQPANDHYDDLKKADKRPVSQKRIYPPQPLGG